MRRRCLAHDICGSAPTCAHGLVVARLRDGAPVAVVALRHEGGDVVVAADLAAAPAVRPHRFETLQAAEAFVGDLIASFAYLGCDVAAA